MSAQKPKIRCAVYTRKSSEDGLEQEFNSLDAQHEACAAYIASQKHEGWRLIPTRYDDGGLSGGTLERPGLQSLMADVDAGRIDMVVIYKIDRLTRSLADFARLVERLEAHHCSFVSVTQAFNTSSSMGRLTLNVLLSFAQFEREVTAERIRDKIAASKKKGLWMGGLPPLGYDPHPDPTVRSLVINMREAQTVETLFNLYDQHGNLREVALAAERLGIVSKARAFASGRRTGERKLSRGQIHHMLTNPIYRGLIRHKDRCWPGQHKAIISEPLWERVQAQLQASGRKTRGQSAGGFRSVSPLIGKIVDETGDRLTPSHTQRRGKRHRYYISNRLLSGGADPSAWRLPAATFEATIADLIASHIEAAARSVTLLSAPEAGTAGDLSLRATTYAASLHEGSNSNLGVLLASGTLSRGHIELVLNRGTLAEALQVPEDALSSTVLRIHVPIQMRRRGVETRFVTGSLRPLPDPKLTTSLAKAHRWLAQVKDGISTVEIATQERCAESYIRTRIQLAFLSPQIQEAILDGTQPPDLTLERLVRSAIPLDWAEQARKYGFTQDRTFPVS